MDEEGNEIEGPGKGNLVVKSSWPSQIRTVYGDHQRCVETYYSTYKGFYFTGDGAERDADGFYRITGRVDDVLNVSGHRLGTAEIESALVLHEAVAEAAVVGFEHEIKGQGIYCYVNLMKEAQASDAIHQELIGLIVKEIGPIAKPDSIQFCYDLPDHQRCVETYYSTYKGFYFTGDGAERDADGFYRITGRVDDVLNVSGHRLGTAEIESALVLHEAVAEAAVVGFEHEIKGQGIYCYVNLMKEAQASDAIHQELIGLIVKEIGPIAKPDSIQFCYDLPKTRSGKIMRRILRKIAENELDNLGDTTTLADPSIVDILIKERLNK